MYSWEIKPPECSTVQEGLWDRDEDSYCNGTRGGWFASTTNENSYS